MVQPRLWYFQYTLHSCLGGCAMPGEKTGTYQYQGIFQSLKQPLKIFILDHSKLHDDARQQLYPCRDKGEDFTKRK